MISNKMPILGGFRDHLKLKYSVERYAAIQSLKVHRFEIQ